MSDKVRFLSIRFQQVLSRLKNGANAIKTKRKVVVTAYRIVSLKQNKQSKRAEG